MTDKEQIIIDGCDVSGCSYGEIEKDIFKCSCEYNVRSASMFCKDNPNCYFKQLARKTQECEEKEKELKELKRQYKLSCLDCEYKNTKADVDRYLKALEEIEEIVNEPCVADVQEDCKHCGFWCEHKDILDIINKAKGEEDE